MPAPRALAAAKIPDTAPEKSPALPPGETITALPVCSPTPCADRGGLTMYVTNVNTNGGDAGNGFRWAKITLRWHDTSGENTVGDVGFTLRDGTSTVHESESSEDGGPPKGCGAFEDATRTTLAPGASWGPLTLCFRIGGPSQPLTLGWFDDCGDWASGYLSAKATATGVRFEFMGACAAILIALS
jgi:hypothetical protein